MGQYTNKGLYNAYKKNNSEREEKDYYATPTNEVINIIRNSKSTEIARNALMEIFSLSEKQATAILEMRLRRLTGLERDKIEAELADLLEKIKEYRAILESEEKLSGILAKLLSGNFVEE